MFLLYAGIRPVLEACLQLEHESVNFDSGKSRITLAIRTSQNDGIVYRQGSRPRFARFGPTGPRVRGHSGILHDQTLPELLERKCIKASMLAPKASISLLLITLTDQEHHG